MATRQTNPYARVNTQANPNPFVPQVLTYRGFYRSPQDLPDPRFLAALGDKMLFGFVLFDSLNLTGGVVGPQQTARGASAQQPGSWITHIVASSRNADGSIGDFAALFYDTQREAIWSTMPIDFSNNMGFAGKPFILKKPYLLPEDGQIQSVVTNLTQQNNTIQIVAWGVRD
jgi:hypothetical protein